MGPLLGAGLSIVVFSLPLALSVWAILDVARRPAWAWALSGRRQVLWLTVLLLGVLTMVLGIAVSAYYLLKVRPVVAAAERGDLAGP